MKALLWAVVAMSFFAAGTLPAAINDEADVRDIQRLQQELENLDDGLETLDTLPASTSRDVRARADEVRDEVLDLRDRMERSQRRGDAGTGVALSEVEDLSRRVRELRRDIEAHSARSTRPRSDSMARGGEMSIPEGTEISIRLEEALSSASAREEDRFKATVQRPVRIDGVVAIPAGA
jgi:hypothetical protein